MKHIYSKQYFASSLHHRKHKHFKAEDIYRISPSLLERVQDYAKKFDYDGVYLQPS